jgi:hypothetical protein
MFHIITEGLPQTFYIRGTHSQYNIGNTRYQPLPFQRSQPRVSDCTSYMTTIIIYSTTFFGSDNNSTVNMMNNPTINKGISMPIIVDDFMEYYELFMLLATPSVDSAEAIPRVLSLHFELAVEISYE